MIEPKGPQYQSTSTTNTDDTVLAPKLTNTLVQITEEKQTEQKVEDDTENNSERMILRQIMI